MAGLRHGRPACIRAAFSSASAGAGFRKRQRTTLHCFKANHKKNHMDLIEGIWREFLDPFDGDSEAPPGRPVSSFSDCSPPGAANGTVPSHALRCGSPGEVGLEDPLSSKAPDPLLKAASWGPTSPEASDVDMQPAEASSPEARGRAARRSGSPEDWRMTEDRWPRAAGPVVPAAGPPEPGRHAQGRARAARPPARLGSEKDKGPKRTLSKRKLELLLAEPEKNKRKKQYVA
ncbi:uncharacterized protein [Callorhinus ursinus]|uniref:Uncharacterized protein LOC112822023 n=1 Tax=Callorhinus ursinus TaxID=34884 RepID=A0A3Q7P467_CALUR|nr:uncharacterized protein LOC112822023 [Callorhinus ursinus]XP_025725132.1 uncharacterized protein LOC112822023 [Callorhinus ursinus]XP_025725133.1 uncharacterized protein LOC112822023 [Callorhinus ursinus]